MTPRGYSSPVRDEAAAHTRRRIVAAATRLLRARGAAGFSLEAVARKANVTRLTVYNQFGSRRALLEAVFDDRAAQGGLSRLGEAVAMEPPQAALARVVEIFCDFWSFDHGAVTGLQRVGGMDAEFKAALAARNARRRGLIGHLAARLADVSPAAAENLTHQLFALTSFAFFAELATPQGTEAASRQVQHLAQLAIAVTEKPAPAALRKRKAGLEPP